MEFPTEIGHVEEIAEQNETVQRVVTTSKPTNAAVSQKVVLIQTPQGVTRAVRVQGATPKARTPGTPSTPNVVQYMKADGSLIQVRQPQVVHRVVTPGSSVVVKGTPTTANKSIVMAKPGPLKTVTKTITMAEAKQMGLISPTGATPAGRVVTLNPTIKSEVPATSAKPTAAAVTPASQSKVVKQPRVVQITPGTSSRVMVATPKVAAKPAPNQQFVEGREVTRIESRKSLIRPEEQRMKVTKQEADRLLQLEGSVVIPGHNQSKVVMLPNDYMNQLVKTDPLDDEEEELAVQTEEEVEEEVVEDSESIILHSPSSSQMDLTTEIIKKRPCNCTKSQCLKLYCECFANGEFCSDCNCKDCFNTLAHEDDRQAAIYNCLERNPNAFRPKIGKVTSAAAGLRHHKGCHCKRSSCLKNYCECFEAKIPCSEMCKCVDCKNCEDHVGPQHTVAGKTASAIKRAVAAVEGDLRVKTNEDDEPPPKQPYNFMTADVVDATVQCMMAQADECQQNGVSYRNTERLILEEFGRCLAEIIDFSTKNGEAD